MNKKTLLILLNILLCFFFVFSSIAIKAVFADEIKLNVGAIFSLSGYGSIGGQDELKGLQLAIEEENKKGITLPNGRKAFINLVVEDNNSSTRQTLSALTKLIKLSKTYFIIGPNWAEFSEVAASVAQREGVLLISTTGYTPNLAKGKPYVFTCMSSWKDQVKPLVRYIS
ncbi:MAG: amino acid ABC transporter substrate-binding protein, partial [Candidatus Dadabacteria bacterium]